MGVLNGNGVSQHLRVLDGSYVVERVGEVRDALDCSWIGLVRAPEGLTVIRAVENGGSEHEEVWNALYSGGSAHGQDEPGMLAALLGPLASSGVPVFVCSTYDADLILVPHHQLAVCVSVLRACGHRVDEREG